MSEVPQEAATTMADIVVELLRYDPSLFFLMVDKESESCIVLAITLAFEALMWELFSRSEGNPPTPLSQVADAIVKKPDCDQVWSGPLLSIAPRFEFMRGLVKNLAFALVSLKRREEAEKS